MRVLPLLSFTLCLTPQPATSLQNPFSENRNRSTLSTKAKGPENAGPLASVAEKLDNSWVRQLTPETPDNLLKSLNYEGLSPELNDNRSKR